MTQIMTPPSYVALFPTETWVFFDEKPPLKITVVVLILFGAFAKYAYDYWIPYCIIRIGILNLINRVIQL